MAQGDVTVLSGAKLQLGDGNLDLSDASEAHKLALTDNVVTPTENDSDPRWGAGGSTNYSTNEVTAGGNYSAGGATLLATGSPNDSWTLSGNTCTYDKSDVTWSQNVSNPTNARWGIGYQDDANDYAIFFLDLGQVFDMSGGDLTVTWNASGIFTLA